MSPIPNLTPSQVVVVGSINCDLIFFVDEFPVTDETVAATRSMTVMGGKGLNQAVASARFGSSVSMIGCIGSDIYGDRAITYLRENQVNVDSIRECTDVSTGIATILVNSHGHNMIAVSPEANTLVDADIVMQGSNIITQCDVLIVQLETTIEANKIALELARRNGVITVLNPAPAREQCLELLPLADYVTPNESEALALTGIFPACEDSMVEVCDKFCALGASSTIITLGELGCFVYHDKVHEHIPPYTVNAIDPTGAGDVFNGAFSTLLGSGVDCFTAAKYASGAAAISTTREGAQYAAPNFLEVKSFIESSESRITSRLGG